jgi:hypothetical protein
MADSGSDREPIEQLAESFLARFRGGERPSLTELVAAHPEPGTLDNPPSSSFPPRESRGPVHDQPACANYPIFMRAAANQTSG